MRRSVLVAGAATAVVLGAGGALTRLDEWYEDLRKPSWQPPEWAFPVAWTSIGALAAWSAVDAWSGARTDAERSRVVGLYAANGALNTAWSGLFFTLRRPDWALAEVVPLWLSIAAMIAGVAPLSRRAAWLLSPYLAWVSVAAGLNRAIVRLNGPFKPT